MDLRSKIREIPDFPQSGILFRDITPLLADGEAFLIELTELRGRSKLAEVAVKALMQY